MFAFFAVANNAATLENLFSMFISCFLGFFIWFNVVTRPFWNYRAKALTK
jgi:ATP/ADP translocase